MIEAKFFTVGTYLYKYNDSGLYNLNGITEHVKFLWYNSKTFWILRTHIDCKYQGPDAKKKEADFAQRSLLFFWSFRLRKRSGSGHICTIDCMIYQICLYYSSIGIFEEKSALCPSLSYLEAVGLVWLERFLQCMKCIPQSYWQTLRRAFKVQ